MKKIALIISLGLLSLLAIAQPRPFAPERMSDEEILRMQVRDIVSWLNLDNQTETRFVKEYTAFRKEIDEISGNAKPPQDIKSEAEIDKAIQQNFAVSEQILQIRKKYYNKFKDYLKPSQIQMMYRIENEAGRRMHDGPGGPGGPGAPARPAGPGAPAASAGPNASGPGAPGAPGAPEGHPAPFPFQ